MYTDQKATIIERTKNLIIITDQELKAQEDQNFNIKKKDIIKLVKETVAENKEGFIWTVRHIMENSDPEGEIKFSHTPIIDIHGNPAIPTRTKNNDAIIDTTLIFENGNKFAGKWRYGNINGFGHYFWYGIGTYKGNWLDGKKSGQGTMLWDDGSRYEGGWALDEFDGEGTYYYNNGDVYIGEWNNG